MRNFQVGDLVRWKTTGRRNETRLVNVIVTSRETLSGWVEVFDGTRTTAVPLYSLSHVGAGDGEV